LSRRVRRRVWPQCTLRVAHRRSAREQGTYLSVEQSPGILDDDGLAAGQFPGVWRRGDPVDLVGRASGASGTVGLLVCGDSLGGGSGIPFPTALGWKTATGDILD